MQKNYNVVHKHTRSLVERTIGQAKKRFYCMGSIIRLKQDRIPSVVVACFILHNEAKRSSTTLRFRTQEMKKTGFSTETHLLLLLETSKQVLMQGYGDMEKLVGQMLQTFFIGELSHITLLLFIYPRFFLVCLIELIFNWYTTV